MATLFNLLLSPEQHHALKLMAAAGGYSSKGALMRALCAQHAAQTGIGLDAWASVQTRYVVMTHDEAHFIGTLHPVKRRGEARYFDTLEDANTARLKLAAPEKWRVGVITLRNMTVPTTLLEEKGE